MSTRCMVRRSAGHYQPEPAEIGVGFCSMYEEAPTTMLLTLDCSGKTLSEASLTPAQAKRLYAAIGEWLGQHERRNEDATP